jgi:tRNA(Arg) A34 adenosine deaminase TadA
MGSSRQRIEVTLPAWMSVFLERRGDVFGDIEARMRLVIDLSRRNIEEQTGGPFAAAVFEIDTGRLVAAGVNVVHPSNCSLWHGETVALALAHRAVGHFDLSAGGTPRELVTSTEPCAMCYGAVPWSGVRRLVCGGREEDARAVGFDEGQKPADWVGALETRGIEVVQDVLREEAAAVLRRYVETGGLIYNGRGNA